MEASAQGSRIHPLNPLPNSLFAVIPIRWEYHRQYGSYVEMSGCRPQVLESCCSFRCRHVWKAVVIAVGLVDRRGAAHVEGVDAWGRRPRQRREELDLGVAVAVAIAIGRVPADDAVNALQRCTLAAIEDDIPIVE